MEALPLQRERLTPLAIRSSTACLQEISQQPAPKTWARLKLVLIHTFLMIPRLPGSVSSKKFDSNHRSLAVTVSGHQECEGAAHLDSWLLDDDRKTPLRFTCTMIDTWYDDPIMSTHARARDPYESADGPSLAKTLCVCICMVTLPGLPGKKSVVNVCSEVQQQNADSWEVGHWR